MMNSRAHLPFARMVFLSALLLSPVAIAQETIPGAACDPAEEHRVRQVGGPENPGTGYTLVCDGSEWKLVTEWDTGSGKSLFQVGNDTGDCTGDKVGRIRYDDGGTPPWEYCDGTDWVNFKQPRCEDDATGECYLDALRDNDDPDFIAENILSGVNILGIEGAAETGSVVPDGPTFTAKYAYGWGTNQRNVLALEEAGVDPAFTPMPSIEPDAGVSWISVDTSGLHSCGVRGDGSAWCWGYNHRGQLGNGNTEEQQLAPVPVDSSAVSGERWRAISNQGYATCGLRDDGSVWCWGAGEGGVLGNGTTSISQTTPVPVTDDAVSGTVWKTISAWGHACGLRDDGTAWCWGYANRNKLGYGGSAANNQLVPVPVVTSAVSGSSWTDIDAGGSHTCGIRDDGSGWCWGYSADGRLGHGGGNPGSALVEVVDSAVTGSAWTTIDAGENHTCGIRDDGTAWCWGEGERAQLGDGGTSNRSTPSAVVDTGVSGSEWTALSLATVHTCGIRDDATVWCWGWNRPGYGTLGNPAASEYQTTPIQVESIENAYSITSSRYSTITLSDQEVEGPTLLWFDSFESWSNGTTNTAPDGWSGDFSSFMDYAARSTDYVSSGLYSLVLTSELETERVFDFSQYNRLLVRARNPCTFQIGVGGVIYDINDMPLDGFDITSETNTGKLIISSTGGSCYVDDVGLGNVD